MPYTVPVFSLTRTLTTHELETTCLASTTSTKGSVRATFLMQLMSKPYTLSHPANTSFTVNLSSQKQPEIKHKKNTKFYFAKINIKKHETAPNESTTQ